MIKIFWGEGGNNERCLKWGGGSHSGIFLKTSQNRGWVKAKVVHKGEGSMPKTPRTKSPRQNILFRNFITFVFRMSYGKEISIWFLAVKYVRHGSIK